MWPLGSITRLFSSAEPQARPANLSAIRTKLSEWSVIEEVTTSSQMGPAVQKAYETAYKAAINRHHAAHSAFPATQAAVRATATPYSTTTDGEATGTTVRAFIHQLYFYTFVGFLLWCLFGAVRRRQWVFELREWFEEVAPQIPDTIAAFIGGLFALPFLAVQAVVRALIQNGLVLRAANSIREGYGRAKERVNQQGIRLRYNQETDTAYLRWQEAIISAGRYKKYVIVFSVLLWFASIIVNSQKYQSSERFMEWTELQRYMVEPIPEILFWQRKEEGSNSHYHWELDLPQAADLIVDDGEEIGLERSVAGGSISATETVGSVVEESTGGAFPPGEKERTPRTRIAFCSYCKQWHL